MHLLFLEIDTERDWAVASIGAAFIAAYVRPHGHRVEMLRVPPTMAAGELVAEIRGRRPDLLGLSLTSRQWLRARSVVREIRRELDVPVVAGGLQPTFLPEEVLASPGFDYVCLGEGEAAALDLLEALEDGAPIEGIDNIWVRGGERPALRPPIEPLDAVLFLARDMMDEPPGVVHMTTQRGCPFPCTYCAARNFNQLYRGTGNYGRRRSHDNVLAELAGLAEAGGLSYVIFLDDTFTIQRRWVEEFCRLHGERFGTPFSLHARVETVDQPLLETLAAAGCRHITYGVESGSYRIRKEVMHRPVHNQRFRDVFAWTREAGIMVTANYMLGIPGETREDLEMTLALAEELDAYDFGYFVFYPYPGTQLFEVCREAGYLPEDFHRLPARHNESVLDLPGLTRDDVAELYDRFTELRERLYLGRYAGPAGGEAGVVDDIRRLAAMG
ncbi:MAG: B12-binding domain-containing radical SAM protein [bacterium]|nr:B12-binding domain-containing radical SAM protein [bacterium]